MKPVLTPAEGAVLDQASEARGISTAELMENAGRAVASAAAELCEGSYGRRAVIMCGKGNNGGDGLVAARHLSRWGMRVSVLLLEPAGTLREPAATNAIRLAEDPSVRVHAYSPARAARELERADVAVDAIFGTGFHGIPEDEFADAIDDLNASDVPVVAVDIPSGVNGYNGAVEGDAVWADVTVTFGAAKPGAVLFPGTERAGLIEVAGIGFPPDLVTSDLSLIEEDDVAEWLPIREPDTHKKATGVVCVVGGSRAMTGAVCLAARAAYRTGAGLVTIAVPEGILAIVQPQVPEATFLPLPQTAAGSLAKGAFDELWKHMGEFDAFAIGPGAGRDQETAEFLRAAACAVPEGLVLDADGLNAFEGRPAELRDRGAGRVVLTPHVGEFARLSGEKVSEIEADRIGSTRRLASETEAVVLLKGTRTLIGEPGGEVRINATGSSALATAGSGDVLTGTVAALLARGLEPLEAASAAAFVHGVAGLRAASTLGEGTTALDVADQVAEAIKDVAGW